MPPHTTSELARALTAGIEHEGFVRRRLTWYRYEEHSILVFNVEPTGARDFGPYINLGVYYLKYGNLREPRAQDCQVSTRLRSLLSIPGATRDMELQNLHNDIPMDVRRDELLASFRSYGMPWLNSMREIETAKAELARDRTIAWVAPIAKSDLEPSP